jgi:putative transposase
LTRWLERELIAAGEELVRVPPKLMAPERRAGRARGKSDPIGALAVARAALREPSLSRPRPDEQPFRELKLLVDHRDDLVDERRRAQQRLRWHLHQLDPVGYVNPSGGEAPRCRVSVPRVGLLGLEWRGRFLVVSLLYLLFRRALAVAALRLRSREFKELEIVVLRHELAVLRRQISRPRLDERDRVFLAAAGRLLGRKNRSFFVRPDTLLGWHRQLVRRRWTYAGRRPGRPAVSEEIRELVLGLARENPRWGYERIVGELAGVGVRVSATTVAKILRHAGVSLAGARAQLSWRDFLRAYADSIIACDFFTVETLWLGRLYVLFFLELGSRRVHFAGCTANPDGSWTAQQARQLAWSLPERATPARFLIHDRDGKFTRAFDEVFCSEGGEIIRTPFRAPKANAFAERWVGTVRRECLDWLLISSRRQLECVLHTSSITTTPIGRTARLG